MYYHGTDKDSAEIIVKTQIMKSSKGNNHWLGDGCYFYEDVEYAFRWILLSYTKNFCNEFSKNYSKVFEEYSVLSAELNIQPQRLFSMDNINHKIIFLDTKKALMDKAQTSEKYKFIIKENGIVDGVVFNYLFKYQGYDEQYDAVKAVFPISYVFDSSRLEYLPEPQICVKNFNVISNYKDYSSEVVLDECKNFIIKYNEIKKSLRNNMSKYKKTRTTIKYI